MNECQQFAMKKMHDSKVKNAFTFEAKGQIPDSSRYGELHAASESVGPDQCSIFWNQWSMPLKSWSNNNNKKIDKTRQAFLHGLYYKPSKAAADKQEQGV